MNMDESLGSVVSSLSELRCRSFTDTTVILGHRPQPFCAYSTGMTGWSASGAIRIMVCTSIGSKLVVQTDQDRRFFGQQVAMIAIMPISAISLASPIKLCPIEAELHRIIK